MEGLVDQGSSGLSLNYLHTQEIWLCVVLIWLYLDFGGCYYHLKGLEQLVLSVCCILLRWTEHLSVAVLND